MSLLTLILLAVIAPSAFGASVPSPFTPTKFWRSLPGVKNIFIFGDSWSDIGFDTSGPFPSSDNPFGNPVYPRLNDSYGAEWPVYFTQQFNSSLVETFVLAKATSVVNNVIEPSRPDLVHQVQQVFLPTWGSRNASSWQSYDTLFIIFIGINDVGITVDSNYSLPGTFDGLLWSYMVLVDQLYQAGARNFLFMNVPPLDRVPIPMANVGPAVSDWNTRVVNLANNLSSTYTDAAVFQFDTHSVLNQVLDNPSSFPTSSQLTNLTGMCAAYDWIYQDKFDPSCGVPLREFFWMNNLHPTYPVHATIAAQLAKQLGG